MKKLFKTLAALAVVAALGFGFVSCSDGGSSSDDSKKTDTTKTDTTQTVTALAIFTCDSGYDTRTLTFNEDSTFKVIVSDEPEPQAAGTYKFVSGDWENGTISLNATSGYKQDTFTGTKTISAKKITFSTKTYTLTGGTKTTPADTATKTDTAATTKTDTTNTNNAKIGDVLLNDGTVVSYKKGMTFTDEQKKKAVCVLAYFNDKGKPVGLGLHNSADGTNSNRNKYKWAKTDSTGNNKLFTDISCTPITTDNSYRATSVTFTGDTDGSDNWAYICSADPEGSANAAENYPAFDYVNNYAATFGLTGPYASGWYMPSIAELCYIYRNTTTVNAVLKALGGTQMFNCFWSSSQFSLTQYSSIGAWVLDFSDGYLYGSNKGDDTHDAGRVCCVRAFSN